MWYLYTVRVQTRIEQYLIQADAKIEAFEELKHKPKLKPFIDQWGQLLWLVSCYQCEVEPKEI